MYLKLGVVLIAFVLLPVAFAQSSDTPFQVTTVSNLSAGDAIFNFTNTGASSTVAFPTQNGNLCVNVYAFDPNEVLLSCCACQITPNGLNSLSTKLDILPPEDRRNTNPNSLVIKLLASTGVATCNAATVGTGANVLATGMVASATSVIAASPSVQYGRISFTNATLSAAELTRMTTLCGFNQTNGGGICRACQTGGR